MLWTLGLVTPRTQIQIERSPIPLVLLLKGHNIEANSIFCTEQKSNTMLLLVSFCNSMPFYELERAIKENHFTAFFCIISNALF